MAIIKIENLSFSYPEQKSKAIDNISISIEKGDFILICGKTGCGKSTLIKQLKPEITPYGEKEGNIYYKNSPLETLTNKESAAEIGYVLQNPDNQIVTDKVWHELAFGLENLGVPTPTIRRRVAEMASFFGIEKWFREDIKNLSGGQKQILNLASIMVMNPKVLILDEPTAQLDPIAATDFINTLYKINQQLSLTIILVEHRLEETFPIADKVLVLDKGKKLIYDTPRKVGQSFGNSKNHSIIHGFPTPIRIYNECNTNDKCPITIREGSAWLSKNFKSNANKVAPYRKPPHSKVVLELKDIWFRYGRELPDILRGVSLKVYKGEIFSILGGNGSGKTTTLNIISGINLPYRGKVLIHGKNISDYKKKELYHNNIAVLPQNPQTLFVKNQVEKEFEEIVNVMKYNKDEAIEKIHSIAEVLNIKHLFKMHPYDLSGGEQQKVALAKILLLNPKIILFDEPTKGLDGYSKKILGSILMDLKKTDVTTIMVSHDIEFCAKYSDRCALFFDGNIVSEDGPVAFFSNNNFYTTAANRMSRHIFKNAITSEDVINLCQQNLKNDIIKEA
ncbi:MAG TPA: ATP-binding cassette domain-containing protein [Tepidimicrobium sp.]|nr:ATP-binding cassette domain-containing protein [Tepidimicrobium sp.]